MAFLEKLDKSEEQLRQGRVITKTWEELEAMPNWSWRQQRRIKVLSRSMKAWDLWSTGGIQGASVPA